MWYNHDTTRRIRVEFLSIFTEMSWFCIALFCLGLAFLIIELFVTGFGFFGITGILSVVAGVIVRICQGLNLVQSLTLILVVIGVMVLLTMIMVYSAQYGLLGHSGLFEKKSTIAQDYNEPDRKIKKLVGKSGKAITDLRLAGKAKIRGKVYDVISMKSYIEKGQHVKVVEIKDNEIVVRKWFE